MTRYEPTEIDRKTAAQAKRVGIVIAVTTVVWLLVQEIGRQYDWAGRWAYLFDFAALAAFIWALVTTYKIWRMRRGH